MKRLILIFLFVIYLLPCFGAPPLSVLVYHHIQEKPTSDVSCTPEAFDSHIAALIKEGFTPLTVSQAITYIQKGEPKVKKPIVITFDDGYESLYYYALPVAKKYKCPMVVFVITSRIGHKPQFARYLKAKQIKEMSDSGYIEFGTHTHDLHTNSMNIYNAFDVPTEKNPVTELLSKDLKKSYEVLKTITGKAPISLAWPYGKFTRDFIKVAKNAGFKIHFTSIAGRNPIGSDIFMLKRFPVTARDSVKGVLKKAMNN